MRTQVTGRYHGQSVQLEIVDGQISRDSPTAPAADAMGLVQAGVSVNVPGMWSGKAALDDAWALRGVFLRVLDRDTARFEGDPPPPLGGGPAGAVY
jgi:hypothetical protein